MDLREIDREEVRRVSELGGSGDRRVLSLYLAVDPPHAPDAQLRQAELGARLDEAERRLGGRGANGEIDEAAAACLGRVRRELGEAPPPGHDVHAVAIFCEEDGELRAYWLRRPPEFEVAASFGEAPAIEPLVEALPGPRWAAALVSRTDGRIFFGSELELTEMTDVEDEVHRRHAQGGWSQARFQRGIRKEVEDHVAAVCQRLFTLHRRRPVDHLVIGGPAEIWPLVESKLHSYLRERLAGQIEIDVRRSSAGDVLERIAPVIAEQRERDEREAVARVKEGLGTGSRSVAGPDQVLAALEEGRVATLLVARGAQDRRVEQATEAALGQSAEILTVERDALESLGEVAALLRF
jgi:peptide chain release factor subunit 1